MKRRPKVRWHPYLMLGLGAVFLLFAGVEFCFYTPQSPSYLMRFATGIYGTNRIGDTFAISLFAESLLVAIGVYGVRYHRD